MLTKFLKILYNTIIGIPVLILLTNLVFLIHSSTLQGIKFQIYSYYKLIIYSHISFKVIYQINRLNFYLKREFRKLTFSLCKLFGCLDYFYGIKDRNAKRSELKICPNKSEIFGAQLIKENFKKSFTEEEYYRFYVNRRNDSMFAIFRIPSFFMLRSFLIHSILFLILQYQVNLIFRVSIFISKLPENIYFTNFSLEEIFPCDLRFLFSLQVVLFFINFFLGFYFVRNIFIYTFFSLGKCIISLSFRYLIWPFLILTFMLYSFKKVDQQEIMTVYSISHTYFYIITIINCVYELFTNTIFVVSVPISLFELLKRLIFITVIPTSLVVFSAFYENIVTFKNVELGIDGFVMKNLFLYCFIIGLVLFFVVLFVKKFIKFIVNWREELFLERRELLNYEDE